MNEMLRRRNLFLIPKNMKLVETIELTQEYIDDEANYFGSFKALKVDLEHAITKEGWIYIFIPSPTEWQSDKPSLDLCCNGMYSGARILSSAQAAPTQTYKNTAAILHVVGLGDMFFSDVFFYPFYSSGGIYSYQPTRKVIMNTIDTSLFELDFRFTTSGVKMPAGTIIKIYSE